MSELDGARTRRVLVDLISAWLEHGGKKSDLLDVASSGKGVDHRVLTAWFSGFLRGVRIWEQWIEDYCEKPPRRKARTVLLAAIAVVWNAREESRPVQVNEWVRLARSLLSLPEARLVNAVLRRVLREGEACWQQWASAQETWGIAWSHPDWLVNRWLETWGREVTESLLRWNQQVPPTYLRWLSTTEVPSDLSLSVWPGFYLLPPESARWKTWIQKGQAYIQDPGTRLAVELLQRIEKLPNSLTLMEWCAAPGGKALMLEEALTHRSDNDSLLHLAVDLPGEKVGLLQRNLARYSHATAIRCIGRNVLDLTAEDLRAQSLPTEWDILFLDVPCSNTGVMARKPEVRYRLSLANFAELESLQMSMLEAAAVWVKPQGHLLYSTCSIETEENEGRIQAFLQQHPNWQLVNGERWWPHETNHDGGGAFLLQRTE